MNKSVKTLSVLLGLLTVVGLVGFAGTANAANDQDKPDRLTPEMRQAWREAIQNNDYQAWLEIAGDRPITEKINADNFSRFAEAFALIEQGDREGAKAIFDELGLERPPFFGKHPRHRDPEKMEAIKTALDNADYQAWLDAVGDRPITEKINEDNFDRLVEAHNLLKAGDKDGAKAIFDELDLKMPHRRPGPRRDR